MSYPITLVVEYPERLSRLTTFFRLIMLIPQVFVFIFVSIAAWVIMFLSWWTILFTAHYLQVFFKFITWWFHWNVIVYSYSYLVTDKYPPFGGSE